MYLFRISGSVGLCLGSRSLFWPWRCWQRPQPLLCPFLYHGFVGSFLHGTGIVPSVVWDRALLSRTLLGHSSFRNVSITSFHLFDEIVHLKSCTIGRQANMPFTYLSMEQVPKYLVINSIIKAGHPVKPKRWENQGTCTPKAVVQPSGFRVFFLKITNYNANECYCIQPWKVLKILSAR